jgi:hypothetical protein
MADVGRFRGGEFSHHQLYNDLLHGHPEMPPALVGILFMVTKLMDGITDLFAGFIIDRAKPDSEKCIPTSSPFMAHDDAVLQD